jgi:hypothetical protein
MSQKLYHFIPSHLAGGLKLDPVMYRELYLLSTRFLPTGRRVFIGMTWGVGMTHNGLLKQP